MSGISNILKYNKYHLFAFGFVGFFAHPIFWVWWTYIYPNFYESIALRLLGMVICSVLLILVSFEEKFKKILPFYWLFVVVYNLPFFFTINLIKNGISDVWLMAQITMIFVTIFFVTSLSHSLLVLTFGIVGALIFCISTRSTFLYPIDLLFSHSLLYGLAFVSAHIFNRSNEMGIRNIMKIQSEEKEKILETLSGTIAHEVRNPLNAIILLGQQARNFASNLTNNSDLDKEIIKTKLLEFNAEINRVIKRANNIIDITLKDIKGQKFDISTFSYLSAADVINTAIAEYGYKNDEEKTKVKFLNDEHEADTKNDFIFKGDETLFIYVLFNLIKNALYYTDKYPSSIITISIQKAKKQNNANSKKSENKNFHQIIIRDEGPGIPEDKLESIFKPFNTSGKVGGTGLGLPFCKRTMKTLQGDIFCRSKIGEYTEFTLLLPALSNEELEIAKQQINQKQQKPIRILIVGDQEAELKSKKEIIEKGISNARIGNAVCDLAKDGKEALEIFKSKSFEYQNSNSKSDSSNQSSKLASYHDIILIDELSEINAIDFSKEIRKIDTEIPIISCASVLSNKTKEASREAGIDDFLEKPISHNYLIKTLCKWTLNKYCFEDQIQKQIDETLKEILKGKNIILADDEMVNRMVLTKILKTNGLEVEMVADGEELIEKYQESIKENSAKKYDIILTDINMQKLNGDLATIKIRELESKNNIKNQVPIIAYSGDGDVKDIHKFLRVGMNDYFIKGTDIKLLIDNIVFWIIACDLELKNRILEK